MPSGYTDPAATIEHNTISKDLQVQTNNPAAVVSGNTVGGKTQISQPLTTAIEATQHSV